MWRAGTSRSFLGREAEIGRLRALVEAVSRGRGGAVLVEGEPGIGKSALLAEGLSQARRRPISASRPRNERDVPARHIGGA
jgi:predicted ATPase